jgi:DNA-binding NtrC family response regulator
MTDGQLILIIDDDEAIRTSLSMLLRRSGYRVATADGHRSALEAAREQRADLALLDMNFSMATSGDEGLALLADLKKNWPELPVILITAWGSIPLAVAGMKAGASDFITKPWNNDQLVKSVKTVLSLSGRPLDGLKSVGGRVELDREFDFEKLVGTDERFVDVLRTLAQVCDTDASVLIEGESGTGKELVAEAVHVNSSRREGPFVKVNLGGIPGNLFESEMFGHKKGAFTDAVQDRAGRFWLADQGTVFLDEIGELDKASQVKLLRVLQDRTFEVLGDSRPVVSDFRLVCATNRSLQELVLTGGFREDLFYRINLITVRMPPLRHRCDDIPLLTRHFVANIRTIYNRPGLDVEPTALQWLKDYAWPGNIRQLKNVVERAVLVSTGDRLNADDFRRQLDQLPRMSATIDLPAVGTVTIDQMEELMIRKALEYHAGNLSQTARSLGLSRAALYRRLEKFGISV